MVSWREGALPLCVCGVGAHGDSWWFPSPRLSHGSHHHTYLTLSTRVGNSFESLVFSSVHSVNFLRQSAGLFILPPVLSSQVIFFLTAY